MATTSHLPSAAEFDRLEDQLFDRISVRHRRQVLRHRLVAAAVVVVLAGAGVAAGTVANSTQQSNLAYCYGGDSLNSKIAQVLLPSNGAQHLRSGARPNAAKVASAVSGCTSAWQSGYFGSPAAPKLRACLRDNLVISVFPKKSDSESADEFCGNLGLSAP